jgi:hypothetical protein
VHWRLVEIAVELQTFRGRGEISGLTDPQKALPQNMRMPKLLDAGALLSTVAMNATIRELSPETYNVDLANVTPIDLIIDPDKGNGKSRVSLRSLRLA